VFEQSKSPHDFLAGASDDELVIRIAQRDESALREVTCRYGRTVLQTCKRVCPPNADYNAVAIDVFWELWQRANNFDPSKSSLQTYLLLIARSRSIDARRSLQSQEKALYKMSDFVASHSSLACVERPDDRPIQQEQESLLHTALAALSAPQREAIELAFFHGCTHEQIARRLSIPLGTIKTRIRTGLMQMRQFLDVENAHNVYASKENR
jgi:RNA polymerase sigma-70 factor, ECF subfamily